MSTRWAGTWPLVASCFILVCASVIVAPRLGASLPTVQGKVLTPEGKPVRGARVYLIDAAGPIALLGSALTDPAGLFSIRAPRAAKRPICVCLPDGWAWSFAPVVDGRAVIVTRPVGSLAGIVLNEHGDPVAGAEVCVARLYAGCGFRNAGPRSVDLPARLRPLVKTITDKRGRFVLSRVPAGDMIKLAVRTRGYPEQTFYLGPMLTGRDPKASVAYPHVLRLAPAAELTGRIVGPKSALRAARVVVHASKGKAWVICWPKLRSDGTFCCRGLVAGKAEVRVEMPAWSKWQGEGKWVDLRPGKTAKVELKLIEGSPWRVRVQFEDGRPARFVKLRVGDRIVRADRDGMATLYFPRGYSAMWLDRAPFTVDGYATLLSAIPPPPAQKPGQVPVCTLRRLKPVHIEVVGDAGRPVPFAIVAAADPYRGEPGRDQVHYADARGRVVVPVVAKPAPTVFAAPVLVSAYAGNAAAAEPVVLWPGRLPHDTVRLRITSAATQCLKCTVVDDTGRPVAGAAIDASGRGLVRAEWWHFNEAPGFVCRAVTDTNGVAVLEPLPPMQRWHVQVMAPGHVEGCATMVAACRSGQFEAKVRLLRCTLSVSGTIVDAAGHPVQGAHVLAAGDVLLPQEVTTDRAGRFRISGAVAGPVALVVKLPDGRLSGAIVRAGQQHVRIALGHERLDRGTPPPSSDRQRLRQRARRWLAQACEYMVRQASGRQDTLMWDSWASELAAIAPDKARVLVKDWPADRIDFITWYLLWPERRKPGHKLSDHVRSLVRAAREILMMDPPRAQSLLRCAVGVAQSATDPTTRTRNLALAGQWLWLVDRSAGEKAIRDALQSADAVRDHGALADLAAAAAIVDLVQARKLYGRLGRKGLGARLAVRAAAAGHQVPVQWVLDAPAALDSQALVCVVLMGRRQPKTAADLAKKIPDSMTRALVMAAAAIGMARAGDRQAANDLINRAAQTVVDGWKSSDWQTHHASEGGPCSVMGLIAMAAQRIGHPRADEFIWRALALRRPSKVWYPISADMLARLNVAAAAGLAGVAPGIARRLLAGRVFAAPGRFGPSWDALRIGAALTPSLVEQALEPSAPLTPGAADELAHNCRIVLEALSVPPTAVGVLSKVGTRPLPWEAAALLLTGQWLWG